MACATISLKRSHEFDPLSPRRPKRRRCTPMTISPSSPQSKPPSVFKESTPALSKEQLADSIRCEIKKLQHRRQLAHSSASQSDSGSDSELQPSTSASNTSAQHKTTKENTPLFTFKQMTMLCEKMVKERTDQLCEEYDKVLANKLAEQYEAFLKFNHDQIQRHFSHSSDVSYLS